MATITFADHRALVVFHGMAEGIAEVREDDGDADKVAALDRLIEITGAASVHPTAIPLPAALADLAADVLGNCLDDSAGMKPDDADAADYVFPGQIEIA